jgi:hypothetical protein
LGDGYPRSEVGAAILSRLASKIISAQLLQCQSSDKAEVEVALEVARLKILDILYNYATSLCREERSDDIAIESGRMCWPASCLHIMLGMYFSATIVGFFASDSLFTIFSIGDGFYSVNGNLRQLDTADAVNNAPAYLSYGLMGQINGISDEDKRFKANWVSHPEDVERAMIATDGVRFMVGQDDAQIPGKSSKVGSISQLWDDKVFVNSDMLRRRLALLNKDVQVPDWVAQTMVVHPAILKDDVAVISVRRTLA